MASRAPKQCDHEGRTYRQCRHGCGLGDRDVDDAVAVQSIGDTRFLLFLKIEQIILFGGFRIAHQVSLRYTFLVETSTLCSISFHDWR